jgi:chromosome segregation ATPase
MDLSVSLQCPCRPGFTYKNAKFLAQHKKSKLHQSWESVQEVKDVRIQSKQFENEIERLKRRLNHKEEVEVELLNRIHQLEGELEYWKKACDGVYV